MNAGRNGKVEPSDLIQKFFVDQIKTRRDELSQLILDVAQEQEVELDSEAARELACNVRPEVSVEVLNNAHMPSCKAIIAYSAVGRGPDGSRLAKAINDRLESFSLEGYDRPLAPAPFRGVLMGKDELVAQALESLGCLGTIDRADGCKIMATLRGLIEWSS